MSSRFCFVFVIFYFAAVLVIAVSLRNANNRTCYKFCVAAAQQSQLKQQLWQQQLRLESIINPAALSKRLEE